MRKSRLLLNLSLSVVALFLATACASTVPKPEFAQRMAHDAHISAKDETKVKIDAGSGVLLLDSEKTRLAEKIGQKVELRKVANPRPGAGKNYEVVLLLTKYEKGNAFARAMLAGLGQIQIDGEITILALPERLPAGKFTISKTFAWGGIYGGVTNIEDIETTFADGVAATLCGQQEGEEKVSRVER